MSTVTVPAEVAKALDHYKEAWNQFPENERAYLFMGLGSQKASNHESEVLKTFAQQQPVTYMNAFMNGYRAELSLKEEVTKLIKSWVDDPWVLSKTNECEAFSEKLIHYIQSRS